LKYSRSIGEHCLMKFPRNRIRFTKSYDGKPSEAGYLLLDLKGLDIEGVTTLALDVSEVEAAKAAGDQQSDALQKAKDLLGGL
jgi:hypothetical protein